MPPTANLALVIPTTAHVESGTSSWRVLLDDDTALAYRQIRITPEQRAAITAHQVTDLPGIYARRDIGVVSGITLTNQPGGYVQWGPNLVGRLVPDTGCRAPRVDVDITALAVAVGMRG